MSEAMLAMIQASVLFSSANYSHQSEDDKIQGVRRGKVAILLHTFILFSFKQCTPYQLSPYFCKKVHECLWRSKSLFRPWNGVWGRAHSRFGMAQWLRKYC